MSGRLQSLVATLVTMVMVAVALACAPGLQDDLIARLPRGILPSFFVWGLADAVTLPKAMVTWVLAPLLTGLSLGIVFGSGRRPAGAPLAFAGATLAFVAWCVVSTEAGIAPALGEEDVVTLACIGLASAATALALDADGARRVLRMLPVAAVPVAIYSLCQHLGLDPLGWDPRHSEPDRTIATFGNPDFFATWMAALVPLSLWRAADAESPSRGALWGGVSGLLVIIVIFSYTRAAWLALAIELVLVLGWCRLRWARPAVAAFTITVISLGVLVGHRPTETFTLVGRLGETVRGDRSVSVRFVLWREALEVAAAHPVLGTGLDTFSYAAMPYRAQEPSYLLTRVGLPGDPHNTYLELVAAAGVPGLLLALALVLVSGGSALRASRSGGVNWQGARVAFVAGLGLLLEQGMVRTTLPSGWLAFVLGAACSALGSGVIDPARVRPRTVVPLALLGLAGAGVALFVGAPIVQADYEVNMGSMLVERALAVGGTTGASLLEEGLKRFERAEGQTGSRMRAARAAARQARALEQVLSRISPDEARGAQRETTTALGRRALALALFALDANRLDPYAWHDVARIFLLLSQRLGEPKEGASLADEAVGASRQGCALDPYNAVLLADHARRLAILKRYPEADEAFRRSLQLAPGVASIEVDHARLLHEWGRDAEATALLREVVRQEPGNAVAVRLLQEIEGVRAAP